jgi:hypothetical protein
MLTEGLLNGLKDVKTAEGKTVSFHILQAIEQWKERPGRKYHNVKGKPQPYSLSIKPEYSHIVELDTPIPFAVICRSAVYLYLKSRDYINPDIYDLD